MEFLHFDLPHLLAATVFLAIIIWITISGFFRAHNIIKSETLNYSGSKKMTFIHIVSLILCAGSLATGILGPLLPWDRTFDRKGVDLIFVLDVSKSMDAEDEKEGERSISRLERAKSIIREYVTAHPENRYGLAIFAGQARLISPLTSESTSILTFLTSVNSSNISTGGSNFSSALTTALDRFGAPLTRGGERSEGGLSNESPHALVLLSDGGDPEDLTASVNIRGLFSGKNTVLYTVGLGTEQGSKIPTIRDLFGNIVYKQYGGSEVITKLNTKNLTALASDGGGSYIHASNNTTQELDNQLQKMARHIISGGDPESGDSGRTMVIVGFIFFLLFLIPYRGLKK